MWLEYVQFCIGFMAEENGMQRVRSAFDRAIGAIGMHPVKGSIIWEAYREFEHALLSGLQPQPGAVQTATQKEAMTAQSTRVDNLFKRQLAVPLLGNISALLSHAFVWFCSYFSLSQRDAEYNERVQNLVRRRDGPCPSNAGI